MASKFFKLNKNSKRQLAESNTLLEKARIQIEELQIESAIKEREHAFKRNVELCEKKEREPSQDVISISRGLLTEATKNFDVSLKIREGSYGSVYYKGFFGRTTVAIKMFHSESTRRQDLDFRQEVKILNKTRHPNIISLIGASLEVPALIYDFLPNDSLDTYLINKKTLWQDRLRIASEICSALIFLHSQSITHGDLKPENVLLDSNLKSKLSGFGLCHKPKQFPKWEDTTDTVTEMLRNPYMDTELIGFDDESTHQCDVFAFGIILLQFVTCREPRGLRSYAQYAMHKEFDKLMDRSVGIWPAQKAQSLVKLGLSCSHQMRKQRPSLTEVVWPTIEYLMSDTAPNSQVKGFLNMETRIEIEKALQKERIEQQKIQKSKVAVELQLAKSKTLLETTTKQHEELQTALRDKLQKAEKELDDISTHLKSSLNAETKKRIEVEKFLQEERIERMKVQELANEHRFALEKLQIERKKLLKERDDALNEVDELRKTNFTIFSLLELEKATDNFNNSLKIGEGGYGSVYKGHFQHQTVAIKILNKESLQGEAEFNQEVEILSKVRHSNLVTLIGASLKARALIYEFVPNGSLDAFLTTENNSARKLSWKDRIRIASEICSVLIFLHSIPPHGIAHGDLKPENILLDSNYVSKLSDFGISRTLQQTNKTITPFHLTLFPKFTPAYCDPEFFSSSELTPQCDIYSFGIILLQLVTGRDPIRIKDFVEDALETGIVDNLADSSAGEWPIEEAKKLALVGLQCSHPSRRKRPDLAKGVWPSIESMKHIAGLVERERDEAIRSEREDGFVFKKLNFI